MANPFVRTAGQLMFAWSLVGIELEVLTSCDKLKLGNKNLEVYQMLVQHVARDNSGLSLARRKDATCFLRWIMSVMTNSTVQACHQKAMRSKTMERRVSTVILNVYQSTGIEKEDDSRQSLENHRKLDEIRRFHNKKFEEGQSLEMLESEHHLVTALSVESWPGALQTTQKHIRGWKIGLEVEMGFPVSEAYGLPVNAKSLVGSVMANVCGSHYPLHMAMVEVSSQRILVDKAVSVPKWVRLARMSHHSHRLLREILGSVPRAQRDDLSEIWGEELLSLGEENMSDFERQNAIGKPMSSVPAPEENDMMHEKMIEMEPLLEASGERNLRSIEITHGECPCHCLAQTVWYPENFWFSVGCRRNSVNRVT